MCTFKPCAAAEEKAAHKNVPQRKNSGTMIIKTE